jgi:hypothetical protein
MKIYHIQVPKLRFRKKWYYTTVHIFRWNVICVVRSQCKDALNVSCKITGKRDTKCFGTQCSCVKSSLFDVHIMYTGFSLVPDNGNISLLSFFSNILVTSIWVNWVNWGDQEHEAALFPLKFDFQLLIILLLYKGLITAVWTQLRMFLNSKFRHVRA